MLRAPCGSRRRGGYGDRPKTAAPIPEASRARVERPARAAPVRRDAEVALRSRRGNACEPARPRSFASGSCPARRDPRAAARHALHRGGAREHRRASAFGQAVSPAFLFATLLWHEVLQQWNTAGRAASSRCPRCSGGHGSRARGAGRAHLDPAQVRGEHQGDLGAAVALRATRGTATVPPPRARAVPGRVRLPRAARGVRRGRRRWSTGGHGSRTRRRRSARRCCVPTKRRASRAARAVAAREAPRGRRRDRAPSNDPSSPMRACVGLGSNLSHPRRQLRKWPRRFRTVAEDAARGAVAQLRDRAGRRVRRAADYVNAVAVPETGLAPRALLDRMNAIERRYRRKAWHPQRGTDARPRFATIRPPPHGGCATRAAAPAHARARVRPRPGSRTSRLAVTIPGRGSPAGDCATCAVSAHRARQTPIPDPWTSRGLPLHRRGRPDRRGQDEPRAAAGRPIDADLLLEQPEDNPFLPRFYDDMARFALPTQLTFLFPRGPAARPYAQVDMFRVTDGVRFPCSTKDPLVRAAQPLRRRVRALRQGVPASEAADAGPRPRHLPASSGGYAALAACACARRELRSSRSLDEYLFAASPTPTRATSTSTTRRRSSSSIASASTSSTTPRTCGCSSRAYRNMRARREFFNPRTIVRQQ